MEKGVEKVRWKNFPAPTNFDGMDDLQDTYNVYVLRVYPGHVRLQLRHWGESFLAVAGDVGVTGQTRGRAHTRGIGHAAEREGGWAQ